MTGVEGKLDPNLGRFAEKVWEFSGPPMHAAEITVDAQQGCYNEEETKSA